MRTFTADFVASLKQFFSTTKTCLLMGTKVVQDFGLRNIKMAAKYIKLEDKYIKMATKYIKFSFLYILTI
ncbi:hypothetical protein FACS189452_00870 [Bacteroidia bacterium]|nr:hypothetical protein FACS189452_00870 [Bacteroidia bacterium]